MFDNLLDVTIAVDPQLGPIAIGYDETLPSVRAWDMRSQRPLWDALQDLEDILDLDSEQISVRGRNVYVVLEHKLFCLDLATGRQKWAHRLAQGPDCEETNGIADPYPPGGHGVILVPAGGGDWLYALDRETGGYLWEREYELSALVSTAENLGTCVVRSDGKVEIFDPRVSERPICTLAYDLTTATVSGGGVLTILNDDQTTEEGGKNGILAFDARTGAELLFDSVEDIDADMVPCGIGGHVFAIRDLNAGIYAGPKGRLLPSPVAGTSVGQILAANHTLGVLTFREEDDARRLVGLDPATLALKFDSGPIGTSSEDDYAKHIATDNASFVFVGDNDAEIRSVDAATGRPLWTHKTGDWVGHHFCGGLVVVRRTGAIDVLHPATGQVVASLAAEG